MMSLDVYLSGKESEKECTCECGNVHLKKESETLFSANITHNLGQMARAAGIYQHLWRPEELGITKASELIEPLDRGIEKLEADPKHFEQYNASNGWGMYEHFVPFVREYLDACKKFPEAIISVSR